MVTRTDKTKFNPGDIVTYHSEETDSEEGYLTTSLIVRYIPDFDNMYKGYEAIMLRDERLILPRFVPYFIPLVFEDCYKIKSENTKTTGER